MNKNLDRRIHPIAEADGLSPKKLVIYQDVVMDNKFKLKVIFGNSKI